MKEENILDSLYWKRESEEDTGEYWERGLNKCGSGGEGTDYK